jgi:hypothetical protein
MGTRLEKQPGKRYLPMPGGNVKGLNYTDFSAYNNEKQCLL